MPLSATVIIPTYNRRRFLMRTLASLGHQSAPTDRYEVVVAIDGSTDDSLEFVSGLRTAYDLHAVYEENKGLAAARNLGAQHAKNDIFIFLDDDQLATPDLVLAHVRAHERRERLFVQGCYPVDKEHLSGGASLLYDRTYRAAMAEAGRMQRQGKPWRIWGGNFSVPAEVWREVGGCDAVQFRNYGCEDTDLGLRLAALGVTFQFEPEARSFHLHECSARSLARQAFQQGRAEATLARKHHAVPRSMAVPSRSKVDSVVLWAWRHGPRAMRAASAAATAGLWLADRLPSGSLQVTAARIVRKLHRARGVTEGQRRR